MALRLAGDWVSIAKGDEAEYDREFAWKPTLSRVYIGEWEHPCLNGERKMASMTQRDPTSLRSHHLR